MRPVQDLGVVTLALTLEDLRVRLGERIRVEGLQGLGFRV